MIDGISGLLNSDMIELDPKVEFPAQPEELHREDPWKWECKEIVLRQIVNVLCRSPHIRNESKLFKDLLNREKKATTAIGQGIAIPHVRTMQPSDLVLCFIRYKEGIEFLSLDEQPVYFIFGVVTPPYDDRKYSQVLPWLGKIFTECYWLPEALRECETAEEARNLLITARI